MNEGIRRVRQSIKQRKKKRLVDEPSTINKVYPLFPTEEEKHGFVNPTYVANTTKNRSKRKLQSHLFKKAIASILLFIGVAWLIQSDMVKLQQPQNWVNNMMKDEFPFAKLNDWYVTSFGAPLSFMPQNNPNVVSDENTSLPAIGEVVETFQSNGKGIMISPHVKTPVSTFDKGVVIFSGNDSQTKRTVIVQHADNSISTYGYLSSIDVHLYQFVNANETIGTFSPTEESEMIYFSIMKDNQFIDPAQVVPVVDIP